MSDTSGERCQMMMMDHDFAIALDRHANARPGNLRRLLDLFQKGNTKKILKYFRDNGIITRKLYDTIRSQWVPDTSDECGVYGCLVKKAQKGFKDSFKRAGAASDLVLETRFVEGCPEFDVVPNRVGKKVLVLIYIPRLPPKILSYKVVERADPNFIHHVRAAADYALSHLPEDDDYGRDDRSPGAPKKESKGKKKGKSKKK